MAISWIPALDPPENVVANVVAGGSLEPNTTYYICITASTSSSWTATQQRSAPSVEVSFTTTSTEQAVNVSWDGVAGANYYSFYITDQAAGSGRWRHLSKFHTRLSSNSFAIRSFDDLAVHPTYLYDTFGLLDNTSPNNISKDVGSGFILIEGACGTITWDTLFAVVPSEYKYTDGTIYTLKGSIRIYNNATGTFSFSYKQILLWQGVWNISSSSAFIIEGTNCQIGTMTWSLSQSLANFKLKNCVLFGGRDYGLQTLVQGSEMYWSPNAQFQDMGGNVYVGAGPIVRAGSVLDRPYVVNSWMVIYAQTGSVFGATIGIYLSFGALSTTVAEIRECVVLRTTNYGYDIRMNYYISIDVPLYDCTFAQQPDNIPAVTFNRSDTYTGSLSLFNSLTLRVVDGAGVGIEGATVRIVNKNNDDQFEVTTDSNGDIIKQDFRRIMITHLEGGGSSTNDVVVTDYNPFILTIEKAGLVKYSSVMEVSEKQIMTVSMKTAPILGQGRLS